jgi:hypothetical protein
MSNLYSIDDIVKVIKPQYKGLKFRVISIIDKNNIKVVTTDKNNKIIIDVVDTSITELIKKSKKIIIDFGEGTANKCAKQ